MSRLLGIDYGRARVGIAISDELRLLAHPLETISAKTKVAQRVSEIVREREIEKIIVGFPRNMSGETGKAADEVNEFVARLQQAVPCPIVKWDERLTTVAAERALREAGKKTRETRNFIDQVAAQMILQAYLDHLHAIADTPEK